MKCNRQITERSGILVDSHTCSSPTLYVRLEKRASEEGPSSLLYFLSPYKLIQLVCECPFIFLCNVFEMIHKSTHRALHFPEAEAVVFSSLWGL